MEMRYFDDLKDGEHLYCQPVVITREAIIEFGKQFDPQPFHIDENAANQSFFWWADCFFSSYTLSLHTGCC
jgi:acyl dehydratase